MIGMSSYSGRRGEAAHGYRGFRIWYADGSVVSGVSLSDWQRAPSHDVQCVAMYENGTYEIYIGNRLVRERYRTFLVDCDYYWLDPERGECGSTNRTSEIPEHLPEGAIKLGLEIEHQAFRSIYERAYQDVIAEET